MRPAGPTAEGACSAEAFLHALRAKQRGFHDSAEAIWLQKVGCKMPEGLGRQEVRNSLVETSDPGRIATIAGGGRRQKVGWDMLAGKAEAS